MKIYDSGVRQNDMTITYKDGLQIIHHPTGIVQELTDKDLTAHKNSLVEQKAILEASIVSIDKDIADTTATIKEE